MNPKKIRDYAKQNALCCPCCEQPVSLLLWPPAFTKDTAAHVVESIRNGFIELIPIEEVESKFRLGHAIAAIPFDDDDV